MPADKIFERQFPANSEKVSVRNRTSRVTCNLNPSPNSKNDNTISILFCFLFRELTDKQTYNELRNALLEQHLVLDSINDSRIGRLGINMAASRNDDVTKK